MRFDWKRFLFSLLAIGAIITVIYYVSFSISDYTNKYFDFIFSWIWMYIWPLPIGAYFARNHIKTWFKPGKCRVEMGSVTVAVICGVPIVFFPGNILFLHLMNFHIVPVVAIFFWYHLLYAFTRDPSSVPSVRDKRTGEQSPASLFDADIK